MCTVLLPPGDNPIAVNKYIISYYYILRYDLVPLVYPDDASSRVIRNVITYTELDFTALHPRRQHPTKHSVLSVSLLSIFTVS